MRSAGVYVSIFQPVWTDAQFELQGKHKLLMKLNGINVYKRDGKLAKSVLLVLEHALAVGDGGSGSGGHSCRWQGRFSVEHIMPQVNTVHILQTPV